MISHLCYKMIECSCILEFDGAAKGNPGPALAISNNRRGKCKRLIEAMAASSLRCIAFAHKQIPADSTTYKTLNEDGLTLLAFVGINDPCRPGVKDAVDTCRSAGVEIKMITADNVFTAKAIATECGILIPGQQVNKGEVVDGEEFRNYKENTRTEKVDRIRVMARTSPRDKLLMMQCLKKKGCVVAIIGHDTYDALALKEADIGLSMGVATNNVAEYRAVILGLSYALERGFRHIRVHGDSKLVCMQEYNSEADAQANLGVHLQDGEVQGVVDRRWFKL